MTQEEKAKAYEDALERTRVYYNNAKEAGNNSAVARYEAIFPQLRESKDERIRKGLIKALKTSKTIGELKFTLPEPTREECIAYLEKQKEQKSERINVKEMVAKYGATDEYIEGEYKGKPINCMIRAYEQGIRDTLLKVKEQKPAEVDESTKRLNDNWMKQHFNDYKEQKPAEWSEEDEDKLYRIIETLLAYKEVARRENPQHYDVLCKAYDELIAWLKFLRPQGSKDSLQTHWKPSEEQMEALETAKRWYSDNMGCNRELESLYEHLKKMM